VRCTPEEKAIWKAAAKQAGVYLSVYLRERLRPESSLVEDAIPTEVSAPSRHQLGPVLARLNNFATVLQQKGVNTANLQQRLADWQSEDEKRDSFAVAIQSKGSHLVNAANLGADRDALQQLTDALTNELAKI